MKKLSTLFAGSLLALGLATPVLAADVVVEEQAPVIYDWNGLYVGVSGGYVSPEISVSALGNEIDFGEDGFLIGGTLGYNAQFGSFVAGIEGDISYLDIDSSYTDLFGFGDNFGGDADASYYATIRGRLGYAFDNILVYGTGGAAFTDLNLETEVGEFDDDSQAGYTVGGGVEVGFTPNLTVKAEYLFNDFGDDSQDFTPGEIETDFEMHVVRVGINYKF